MKIKFLTMNVYINAWLDCKSPFISLHNKFDDDLLLHFNSKRVEQLIDDGEIHIEDLKSTDSDVQIELISTLMAVKSQDKIHKQMVEISSTLNRREVTPTVKKHVVLTKKPLQIIDLFPSQFLRTV